MRLAAQAAALCSGGAQPPCAVVLGTGLDARVAAQQGFHVLAAVAAPAHVPWLARRTLRKQLGPHLAGRTAWAWGAAAAALARQCAARCAAVDALLPGVASAALVGGPEHRAALRARWEIPDGVAVLGLLGTSGHARAALDVAVRAVMSGVRVAMVVHPAAIGLQRTQAWLRQAAQSGAAPQLVCEADLAQPWLVRCGLDAALATSTHACVDAALMAQQGVPVLSTTEAQAGLVQELTFDRLRPTVGALALAGVLRGTLAHAVAAQRAHAAALPGPADVARQLGQATGLQRAAA